MDENREQIDFVVAWVDGADEAWRCERARYAQAEGIQADSDDGEARYRDWGILKYWFRGVETYAPWVHKVYFVTCGQLPPWLNTDCPKLVHVKHSDYIPAEFLPTFNSHTIEWNFHRISGLSERFVYFNDDMFVINRIRPEDFFVGGLPKDMLALQPVIANESDTVMPYIYLNNAMVLAKYFDKRENVRWQPGSYFHPGYPPLNFFYNLLELAFPRFTGFYTAHGPSPLKKAAYRTLWELEGELLSKVCSHKFRERGDVSQYLLREWQKLSGRFVPANIKRLCRYFELGGQNGKLLQTIRRQSAKMVCVNDTNRQVDEERLRPQLLAAFEEILPHPSAFELQ